MPAGANTACNCDPKQKTVDGQPITVHAASCPSAQEDKSWPPTNLEGKATR
jgi:hypothetical protein